MADVEFKFKIEADNDGYVSYECPFCKSTFSLNASEVQSNDPVYTEIYCPYCGLNDKTSNFYTQEVIEQAQNIAMNYMIDEVNKAFKKVAKNNNKYVKIKTIALINKKDIFKFRYILPNKYIIIIIGIINNVVMHRSRANK